IGVGSIVTTTVSRRGTTPASKVGAARRNGSAKLAKLLPALQPADLPLDWKASRKRPWGLFHAHVWCVSSGYRLPPLLTSPVVLLGGRLRHTNRNNTPHYRLEIPMYADTPALDLPDIEPDEDDLHALASLPWEESQAHLERMLVEAGLLIQQDNTVVRNIATVAGGDTELGVAA